MLHKQLLEQRRKLSVEAERTMPPPPSSTTECVKEDSVAATKAAPTSSSAVSRRKTIRAMDDLDLCRALGTSRKIRDFNEARAMANPRATGFTRSFHKLILEAANGSSHRRNHEEHSQVSEEWIPEWVPLSSGSGYGSRKMSAPVTKEKDSIASVNGTSLQTSASSVTVMKALAGHRSPTPKSERTSPESTAPLSGTRSQSHSTAERNSERSPLSDDIDDDGTKQVLDFSTKTRRRRRRQALEQRKVTTTSSSSKRKKLPKLRRKSRKIRMHESCSDKGKGSRFGHMHTGSFPQRMPKHGLVRIVAGAAVVDDLGEMESTEECDYITPVPVAGSTRRTTSLDILNDFTNSTPAQLMATQSRRIGAATTTAEERRKLLLDTTKTRAIAGGNYGAMEMGMAGFQATTSGKLKKKAESVSTKLKTKKRKRKRRKGSKQKSGSLGPASSFGRKGVTSTSPVCVLDMCTGEEDEDPHRHHRHAHPHSKVSQSDALGVKLPYTDAMKYAEGGVFYAFTGRTPALCVTFCIELIPAFVVASGAAILEKKLNLLEANTLIGFLTVISAISGNVGLQASALMTRSLSHAFTNRRNAVRAYLKEIKTAVLMGVVMGSLMAVVSFVWARSVRVSIILLLAQMLSIVVASITGTSAPLLFHGVFGRDPGMWAGPLETATQDIVGATALFFGGVALLNAMPNSWH